MNTPIITGTIPLDLAKPDSSEVSKAQQGFSDMLVAAVEQVNSVQQKGDQAIADLNTGNAQHLHDVMIAMEEADLSLRMLVQVRNKAQEAFDSVMRLQL